MGSVNKVILIGNLGSDPELKHTASSKAVCNLSVATNETWKDKQGQKQERTEWHRVTVWGDQAENCAKYLAKGRSVYVEGRLQTRKWQDKEGKDRYSTDVVADRVVFLGGKDDGAGSGSGRSSSSGGRSSGGSSSSGGGGGRDEPPPPSDDDIPFVRLEGLDPFGGRHRMGFKENV